MKIFIILVFLIFLVNLSKENFYNNSSCILLTTSVYLNHKHNSRRLKNLPYYRKKLYIETIEKYRNIYNGIIYIVDSSGYKFEEFKNYKNIKILSFDLNNFKHNYKNKTPMEAISIIYAFRYFKLYKYDVIFKITGKYFIKDINNITSNIDNSDFYIQHFCRKEGSKFKYQPAEILGFKKENITFFYYLAGKLNDDKCLESSAVIEPYLTQLLNNSTYKFKRLSKIMLEKPIERGCNKCDRKILYYI